MASFAPIRGTRAQIQATPIVDGQFLVETDQGVDNMIYMDEGSTRTIVGGNTVTGVLPELYIYSETGSVVTVEDAGGTLIPTSQVGTDHWVCEVPDYGVYTVYSVLSGDTTTQSINVTDCMIYTIDDSHFHCNVVVTYPSGVGASCQISGGGETYSAPALNPPDTSYKFVVHGQNTTYTITTNVDGIIKTETVTTGAVLDQTYNVTMPYARVNLTVEMPPITGSITCTDGTTTITRVATPSMSLYLDLGTWTISGSDGVDVYDTEVTITDFNTIYEADLSSAPDGATVLPTDVIQTWLKCAKIRDKSYTTLEEVLNDNETLQKLISSDNAMNYLVRSTSWTTGKGLVPTMTSNTEPSGEVLYNNYYSNDYPWYAFDGNVHPTQSTNIYTSNQTFASYTPESEWIGYKFTKPTRVTRIDYTNSKWAQNVSFYVEGKNNSDTNWTRLNNGVALTAISPDTTETFIIENYNEYDSYRLLYISGQGANGGINCPNVAQVQFYTCAEDVGICDDSTAMRLIGEKNYASNTLLNDEDWRNGIADSSYFESVLNIRIPVMTSNTTPSGQASGVGLSSGLQPYYAFDENPSTRCYMLSSSVVSGGCNVTYDFQRTLTFYKIKGQIGYASSTGSACNGQIQIFDTVNNAWADVQSITISPAHPYTFDKAISPIEGDKIRYFSNSPGSTSGTYVYGEVVYLNAYSREDVDETVYNIYSAADDTILATPQGGGTAVTITTNNDGYGTITKTNLPNGTYTFVSSKANDPDNLSDYYSKTITIFNGTIEVAIMPNNTLYWFGYIDSNCGGMTSANGWGYSGYSMGTPTFNTNKVTFTTSSGVIVGITNKNPIHMTKVKAIVDGITPYGSNFYAGCLKTETKQDWTPIDYYWETTGNLATIETVAPNTPVYGYSAAYSQFGGSADCYALWYEE